MTTESAERPERRGVPRQGKTKRDEAKLGSGSRSTRPLDKVWLRTWSSELGETKRDEARGAARRSDAWRDAGRGAVRRDEMRPTRVLRSGQVRRREPFL